MGFRRYHWVAGSPDEAVAALHSTPAGRLERRIGTVIRRQECQSEADCPKIEPGTGLILFAERLSLPDETASWRNILKSHRPGLSVYFRSTLVLHLIPYTKHPTRASCCYFESVNFILFQQIIQKHRQPRCRVY
jgi:hypothetical protein